ncbi:MAG: heparinase II/III family protein, partial [Bacteroidales bacterium]|nr:heparinase II/III family protein [Bacteroidales bacterium]
TEMHNVLTKARKSYEKREGKMLLAENTSGYEVLVTENPSYSDLTIRRAIFFVDNTYYVIVDEAYGDCADTQLNLNFKLWGGKTADESGKNYTVIDALEGNSAGAHSIFDDKNNLLIKSFSETSDNLSLESGTGYFSNEIDTKIQRWWYRFNVDKQAGKAVRMISVLLPYSGSFESQSVQAEFTDNTAETAGTFHPEGVSLKVTVNGVPQSLSYKLN